ncbi:hypothetical protein OJF2_77650 [Aquisphaera giovannonii]|uniref:Uncharacterized protein n=1 Tax=Aquisphaera giovannonii TaxID=406548 RepID=A0A5B9WFA1_9BACT|nr:hypothetical protein [Aquisphaera giovannonii]QEH39153.1 hypothetical protein OJF2_77650 [Aquisphaera giovannonii]
MRLQSMATATGLLPGPRRASLPACGLALALAAAAGCEEERNVDKKPAAPNAAAAPAPAKKAEPEFIVGKRTQDIKNARPELQKGAQVGSTKITAKDYITLQGNAYVTAIGQTSILSIQHAMDLYHAENDRYPKNYQEFMDVIIKANNIALPKLPHYQDYGYDEKEHKLIILEYPDRR